MVFKPKYSWLVDGIFPVDAQAAGEEMERIYEKHGTITPEGVVEESRPDDAPLHDCFEWRDKEAAEKYREHQARGIIRALVIRHEEEGKEPVYVRSIVHVQKDYTPMNVVVETPGLMDALLSNAFREMESFKRKYQTLSQLQPVFDAIDNIKKAG